jgi:hypothetical protein
MPGAIADTLKISGGAWVALVAIAVVEVALAIYCIVDIVRRPAVSGGHKWVWIVIVALFNLIGSIVYLAVGRAQPEAAETRAEAAPEAAARGKAAAAADLLYGPPPAGHAGPGADLAADGQQEPRPQEPRAQDAPAAPEAPEPPADTEGA